MNKKNIGLVLLVALSFYNPILFAEQNNEKSGAVVPIFSPRQLDVQMARLMDYLDKVKRCMATGPCTQGELAQVKRHALILTKSILVAAAMGLFASKGVPAIKRKLAEQTQEAVRYGQKVILTGIKGVVSQEEDEDPEIAALKADIKEAAKQIFRGGIQFVIAEFRAELDGVLSWIESHLWKIPGYEEAKEEIKAGATRLAWSLPEDDLITYFVEKWTGKTKEELVDLLQDEKIRKGIGELIDKLGKESHVIDFLKKLKEGGIDVAFFVEEATKLGIPTKGWLKARFGKGEGDVKELQFGGKKQKKDTKKGKPQKSKGWFWGRGSESEGESEEE